MFKKIVNTVINNNRQEKALIKSDDDLSENLVEKLDEIKIKETIKKFKSLDLKLEKSPSDKYFLGYFNKIYGNMCLDTTLELLEKIKKIESFQKMKQAKLDASIFKKTLINNDKQSDINKNNIQDNFLITQNNVKNFLYSYLIVTNHHEIFGVNTALETNLVKSSLDMLYIFIKLCDKIYHYKLDKIEILLKKFKERYQIYYQHFEEWKNKDAKELLDVLTLSYYNLVHNLFNVNKDGEEFKDINNKINDIENKIQYLICDNTPNKSDVKKYIYSNMMHNKLKNIKHKSNLRYWEIQIYNLENESNILESTQNIFEILQKKISKLSAKYSYQGDISPIPEFLKHIENKHLDFEIFSNKYFLNSVHYLIRFSEEIDFISMMKHHSKNKHKNNDDVLNKKIVDKIVKNKYKKFAQEFLEKEVLDIVPKILNNVMNLLHKL